MTSSSSFAPGKPKRANPPQKGASRRKTEPPSEFDRWLDHRLQNMFNAVLDEPLPEDLVKLVKGSDPGNRK